MGGPWCAVLEAYPFLSPCVRQGWLPVVYAERPEKGPDTPCGVARFVLLASHPSQVLVCARGDSPHPTRGLCLPGGAGQSLCACVHQTIDPVWRNMHAFCDPPVNRVW